MWKTRIDIMVQTKVAKTEKDDAFPCVRDARFLMQVLCVNQRHYSKSKIDSRYWPITIVTCKMQTKYSDIKVPKLHMLPKNPKARGSVWLSKSMDINRLVRFRILRYIAPLYDRIPMRLCSTSNVRGAAKTAGPAAVIAGLLLLYYWVANNTHFPRSVNHTHIFTHERFSPHLGMMKNWSFSYYSAEVTFS